MLPDIPASAKTKLFATLITLLGAGIAPFGGSNWFRLFAGLGLLLGIVGVCRIVLGCGYLFRSTRVSPVSLQQEAALVRRAQHERTHYEKS
jgi:hypothetical protein